VSFPAAIRIPHTRQWLGEKQALIHNLIVDSAVAHAYIDVSHSQWGRSIYTRAARVQLHYPFHHNACAPAATCRVENSLSMHEEAMEYVCSGTRVYKLYHSLLYGESVLLRARTRAADSSVCRRSAQFAAQQRVAIPRRSLFADQLFSVRPLNK
jgi:hypothetical protein